MALLFFDGFEANSSTTPGTLKPGWIFDIFQNHFSIGGRLSGSKGIAGSTTIKRDVTPSATLIVGAAYKRNSQALGATDNSRKLISLFGDSGATQHLAFTLSSTAHIQMRLGGPSGTIIATASEPLCQVPQVLGNWYYIEIKATIDDVSGTCVVRTDGREVINFTGDTRNGGTSTNIDRVEFGIQSITNQGIDDLVIMDGTGSSYNDFIGDRAIKGVRPNGNGATNQWVGSDADSIDNYLLVDEVTMSTSDYTGSAITGDRDLYDHADVTGLVSVDAVQVCTYAAKSDATAQSIKTVTRSSGGTVLASSAETLSTTYNVVNSPILQTDADAAAWTLASVNSAQFGVEVGG